MGVDGDIEKALEQAEPSGTQLVLHCSNNNIIVTVACV